MWLTPISGVLEHLVVVPLLIEGKCSDFIVGDVVGRAEILNNYRKFIGKFGLHIDAL